MGSRIPLIFTIANGFGALVLTGLLLWNFQEQNQAYQEKLEKRLQAEKAESEASRAVASLEPAKRFFVSLRPFEISIPPEKYGRPRVLRVTVALELEGEGMKTLVRNQMPRVRDRVLSHLLADDLKALDDLAYRERLKHNLLSSLRSDLKTRQIAQVYFENLVYRY